MTRSATRGHKERFQKTKAKHLLLNTEKLFSHNLNFRVYFDCCRKPSSVARRHCCVIDRCEADPKVRAEQVMDVNVCQLYRAPWDSVFEQPFDPCILCEACLHLCFVLGSVYVFYVCCACIRGCLSRVSTFQFQIGFFVFICAGKAGKSLNKRSDILNDKRRKVRSITKVGPRVVSAGRPKSGADSVGSGVTR